MQRHSAALKLLDLPGGALMPLRSIRGERVRVLCGRVWLTQEGQLHDAVLVRGDELALGGGGLAVIEALTAARVELFEPKSLLDTAIDECRSALRWLGASWLQLQRRPISACSRGL